MRFTHVQNKCLHSVFPNQYSDIYFRIVSFICCLFITCTRNKTFSLAGFTPFCSELELNWANKNGGSIKMAGRAQKRLGIAFNVIFLIISFSGARNPVVRRGFNSHPKILKLHFTQLVPVYVFPILKFTTLYFNFHLV